MSPLFSPAGTITAAEMTTRIVAKRHARRPRAFDVFENSAGEIFIPNAAELEIQVDHYRRACRTLLDALAEGAIIAQVELDGRWLDISPTYWETGSGHDAVVDGRIIFNGGPPKGYAPFDGLAFFAEEAKFEAWIRQGPKGPGTGTPGGEDRSLTRTENQAGGSGSVYHTGVSGRPSSWGLVEAECRRRFGKNERHPGSDGVESASEWASVLVDWLKAIHPDAPLPTQKTLTNRLSPLLRELARNHSPK
jgi:hypothetical protein